MYARLMPMVAEVMVLAGACAKAGPAAAPSQASIRKQTPAGQEIRAVDTVSRKEGGAVRIVYRSDSAPDPVTGKVIRDEVERYEFYRTGRTPVLVLTGPVGADNVDPWRTVSDSFQWK